MPNRLPMLLRFTALSAALALAACNRGAEQENLADLSNGADPALTSALNDQILVDPSLANQSNRTAVRPPATPTQAQYPAPAAPGAAGGPAAGPAAGARAQLASGGAAAATRPGSGCTDPSKLDYNANWAGKLPAHFPLYPGARVTEAAGTDRDGCHARVVTFTTADNGQRVLDWYHTRAVKAGYSSEHQLRDKDHVLAGTSGDGGAFYLIVTPGRNGAEVALIANRGA